MQASIRGLVIASLDAETGGKTLRRPTAADLQVAYMRTIARAQGRLAQRLRQEDFARRHFVAA